MAEGRVPSTGARDTTRSLRNELGRDPGPGELAAAMGLSEAELETLRQTAEPVRFESLD